MRRQRAAGRVAMGREVADPIEYIVKLAKILVKTRSKSVEI